MSGFKKILTKRYHMNIILLKAQCMTSDLSTLLKRWCNKSNNVYKYYNAVTLLHLNAKQSYQLLHRVKEARPTLRLQLTQ